MKTIKQYKQRKNCQRRLPLHVYMAYFLICTFLLTGVSFSRYVSNTHADDRARGAKGVVTVSYDQKNTAVEMTAPADYGIEQKEFQFQVSNNTSEVAIKYDVVVTVDQPLVTGVTMTLDGKRGIAKEQGKEYEFSNVEIFEAGVNKTNTHTLLFAGDFKSIPPSTFNDYKITITIRSQQID